MCRRRKRCQASSNATDTPEIRVEQRTFIAFLPFECLRYAASRASAIFPRPGRVKIGATIGGVYSCTYLAPQPLLASAVEIAEGKMKGFQLRRGLMATCAVLAVALGGCALVDAPLAAFRSSGRTCAVGGREDLRQMVQRLSQRADGPGSLALQRKYRGNLPAVLEQRSDLRPDYVNAGGPAWHVVHALLPEDGDQRRRSGACGRLPRAFVSDEAAGQPVGSAMVRETARHWPSRRWPAPPVSASYGPTRAAPPEARSIDALLIDESIEMPRQMAAFIRASGWELPVVAIQLDAAAQAGLSASWTRAMPSSASVPEPPCSVWSGSPGIMASA